MQKSICRKLYTVFGAVMQYFLNSLTHISAPIDVYFRGPYIMKRFNQLGEPNECLRR